MNECHFLGNLTRDPELRELASGKRVVKFGIAVNRRYKKNGEVVKEVSFLDHEAWDVTADIIAKHFQKGDAIIVHSSVQQDNWKDKNTGDNRSKLVFRVNRIDFVPGGKKTAAPNDAEEQTTTGETVAAEEVVTADNIPF